jgi:hypothetical protein
MANPWANAAFTAFARLIFNEGFLLLVEFTENRLSE